MRVHGMVGVHGAPLVASAATPKVLAALELRPAPAILGLLV
jgi:hypothetical protein